MLPKHLEHAELEARIASAWADANAFAAGQHVAPAKGPKAKGKSSKNSPAKPKAEPFCIVIPPPNVTGSLHMGHALNNTIQDILCRFERMRGKDVLWQPGTDHAGIATQMVVERQMAARQEPDRRTIGREAFLEKVWAWKAESGGTIVNQLKRLGASCDWSRERFTMDEGLSRAVLEVFVKLYNDGLIYRGKRLVNWDPQFETAISDLEVENIETDGHMWHFKYPLAGGETYDYIEKDADGAVILRETRDYISIATTRPETMLGDGAVAVHPSDARYAPIVGKLCEIPVGPKQHRRLIPIITDEYPDPNFGSGAVKITGAHDFNDYQVARRNTIPLYRLMDTRAAMRTDGLSYAECAAQAQDILASGTLPDEKTVDAINLVPDALRGLDRLEARKRVIAQITEEGLAVMTSDADGQPVPLVEKKKIMQPFGDRSHAVIEPMLTDQWFADAKTLAQPAIAAVREGRTRFVPEAWDKTYFQWMDNIEPWCISRQLWWGHQIPAWYGPDGKIFVAKSEQDAEKSAKKHYGKKPFTLTRDPDVLDTWFSSALWPFSTLGWPDKTPELKKYYPTSVLVTGFDIIFFWVARMMMMGLHTQDKVPFHTVYIHALVRDEKGRKMSKSLGNVIDPLELIKDYGADAVRFTLAAMAAQGRDIKLSKERVAGYRNFTTKLLNAARFAELNGCALAADFDPAQVKQPINQWITGEAQRAAQAVTAGIEAHKYNEAAAAIYRFVWDIYCDWYLELIKPILSGPDGPDKSETQACAAWVLDQILILLHPFMPFVTEELWTLTAPADQPREQLLCHTPWPTLQGLAHADADREIAWIIKLVSDIRSVRTEMNVPPATKLPLMLIGAGRLAEARATTHGETIKRLARLEAITTAKAPPKGAVQLVLDDGVAALPLAGVVDLAAEMERLNRELKKVAGEMAKIEAKLGNAQFVQNAPEEIIALQRERMAEFAATSDRLHEALSRLKAAA